MRSNPVVGEYPILAVLRHGPVSVIVHTPYAIGEVLVVHIALLSIEPASRAKHLIIGGGGKQQNT